MHKKEITSLKLNYIVYWKKRREADLDKLILCTLLTDKRIFCSLILGVYMAHLQACNHLDLTNQIFMAQGFLVQV